MSKYEEELKLIEEKFGNGKDNVIYLATIARESGTDGKPRPIASIHILCRWSKKD